MQAEDVDGSTAEARSRLLQAWRGEIEAGAMYALIAQRENDSRRAEILRRMSEVEGAHRRRLEARMTELGMEIPDPSTVRISAWSRLQARFAPVGRLLAQREAAEDTEVEDLYRKPTGDATTDALLEDIRRDEGSHRVAVREMRAEPAADRDHPKPAAQTRLDRILGRETWHQRGGSWISGAIYGANDGLAAVFGIVSGVSGATGASGHFVLTAGLAGAVASALSMATGAFLAERSEGEVAAANLDRERREIEEHPEEEREEISLYYQLKGLSHEEADAIAERVSHEPEAMLKILATEELGGAESGGDPVQAGIAAGISTGVGAIVPVIPFFFVQGMTGVIVAAIVSLIAHFLVGAAKSLVTLRTWWSAGLEMTLAGVLVGGATFLLGLLFKVST